MGVGGAVGLVEDVDAAVMDGEGLVGEVSDLGLGLEGHARVDVDVDARQARPDPAAKQKAARFFFELLLDGHEDLGAFEGDRLEALEALDSLLDARSDEGDPPRVHLGALVDGFDDVPLRDHEDAAISALREAIRVLRQEHELVVEPRQARQLRFGELGATEDRQLLDRDLFPLRDRRVRREDDEDATERRADGGFDLPGLHIQWLFMDTRAIMWPPPAQRKRRARFRCRSRRRTQ